MKTRVPDCLQVLTSDVEKHLRKRLNRGTVFVSVEIRRDAGDLTGLVDSELLDSYAAALDRLAEKRGSKPVSLDALVSLPGVIREQAVSHESIDEIRPAVLETLNDALDSVIEMRRNEGQHLKNVLVETADRLESHLNVVREGRGKVVDDYRKRLRSRVAEILNREGVSLSDADVAREVAFFADRSDITEEIDRLDSHVSQLRGCLEQGKAVGKRMEFIVQEMFREANTLLAKISDPALSEQALFVKSEIEKMKEQALNVE